MLKELEEAIQESYKSYVLKSNEKCSMTNKQEIEIQSEDVKNELALINNTGNDTAKVFLGPHHNDFDFFSRECKKMHVVAMNLEMKC